MRPVGPRTRGGATKVEFFLDVREFFDEFTGAEGVAETSTEGRMCAQVACCGVRCRIETEGNAMDRGAGKVDEVNEVCWRV